MEWNQTPECLLTQSIHAAHARTRERFSALYQVATGRSPVAVAQELGRRHDTVTGWINRYNSTLKFFDVPKYFYLNPQAREGL